MSNEHLDHILDGGLRVIITYPPSKDPRFQERPPQTLIEAIEYWRDLPLPTIQFYPVANE